jgi:hypothetical protein
MQKVSKTGKNSFIVRTGFPNPVTNALPVTHLEINPG